MPKRRTLIITTVLGAVVLALVIFAAAASSAPGGRCGFPVGKVVSYGAKGPGSTAGPNSQQVWTTDGTPNNPGQFKKQFCPNDNGPDTTTTTTSLLPA